MNLGTASAYLDLNISRFKKNLSTSIGIMRSSVAKMQGNTSDALKKIGTSAQSAGAMMTTHLTLPLVGMLGAVGKVSADFEQSMSKVSAISGATGKEFEKLRSKAVQLGNDTVYSATNVADAMTEMAKAGWNTQQILDGMEGVLNATSASGEDLATVSTIVADTLTGFGLEASKSTHVADLLTQSANAGTIGIVDLGESFKYAVPTARAMGFSIEDVTTAVTALSKANIKGSMAGTSLNIMFSRLANPVGKVKTVLDKLNIEVTNADGSFKDLNTIISIMRSSFAGLTQQEKTQYATIIAGREGMKGLLALMNMTEAEYQSIADTMENADGVAKRTALKMLDNLKGQFTLLLSKLQAIAIQFGEILLPVLSKVVEKVGEFADWISSLDKRQKTLILTITALVASAGPMLLIFGKMLTFGTQVTQAIQYIPQVLQLLNGSFSALGGSLAGISATMAGVIAVVAVLGASFITLWNTNEEFKNNMVSIWEELKTTISTSFAQVTQQINDLFGTSFTTLELLKVIWQGFCDFVAPIFTGAFQYILNSVQTYFGIITSVLDIFVGVFTGDWSRVWEGVKSLFTTIWNGIVTKFKNIINTIKSVANTVLKWFGTSWNEQWTKVKSFFVNIWNGIVNFFTVTVRKLPSKVISIGKDLITGLWNGINDKVEWIKNKIKGFTNDVKSWFQDFFDIHSPSKWVQKHIGRMLPPAIPLGMEDVMHKTMVRTQDLLNNAFSKLNAPIIPTPQLSGLNGVSVPVDAYDIGSDVFRRRPRKGRGTDTDKGGSGERRDTYNFYINEQMSEVKLAKEFKRTKRDLEEGF